MKRLEYIIVLGKKIINNLVSEMKLYLAEFYASSSFWLRAAIIGTYIVIVVTLLIVNCFIIIPQSVAFIIWCIVMVLVIIFSHFLSTGQKVAMTASWILFFGVLVGFSPLPLIFTYCYLKFQFSMYVKGPYVRPVPKSKKPKYEKSEEDKDTDNGTDNNKSIKKE